MIPYNTQLMPLRLPEYGRNIHQMIDYCVHIEDREERNRCAYQIAHIMEGMFPDLISGDEGRRKIWNHINIIADFKLDVDFPFPVMTEEEMKVESAALPYKEHLYKHRHYGRLIQQMIDKVADMDESPERDALISMIANHMKKLMLSHNPEGSDDAKILQDLAEFSNGKIILNPETYMLHVFHDITPEPAKKKKKK